ncbi:hypothetical protein P3T37_000286 [Kitasatospora sp. MAA4]|nr:hypothetical protein [Kitasatospora sp. MAA4]
MGEKENLNPTADVIADDEFRDEDLEGIAGGEGPGVI